MKDFEDILTQLQADLEADIPALLATQSLSNFAEYKIGGSKNPEEIGFFIYFDGAKISYDRDTITVIVQLQLYKVEEENSAKYISIVSRYLESYDPQDIGCNLLEDIDIESWPIEQNQTTFVYITCTWLFERDSCDI